MQRSPLPLPMSRDSALTSWLFGVSAAAVAAFLMLVYVQLLQDSVARGAQWRYSQKTLAPGAQYGASPSIVVR